MKKDGQATSGGPHTSENVQKNIVQQTLDNFTTRIRSNSIGSVSQYANLIDKRHGLTPTAVELNFQKNLMEHNSSQQAVRPSTPNASDSHATPWQLDKVPDNKKKRKVTSPVDTDQENNSKIHKSRETFTVPTSNRFPLFSSDLNGNEDAENSETSEQNQPKPEPIFATGINSIQTLKNILSEEFSSDQYTFSTMRSGHQVKIMPADVTTYKGIVGMFDTKNVSYYTYRLKHERTYRAVIRGIHHSEDKGFIQEGIEKHGHKVRQIINVRHRLTKDPLPLFYVDLEPARNNINIFDIKSINNACVTIEPPKFKKEAVQCKRCQRFGHTKNLCRRPFRCVKCGGDHDTRICTKPRETSATCANCNEEHPASYKGCRVYKDYKTQISGKMKQPSTTPANNQKATNNQPRPEMTRPRANSVSYSHIARQNTQWEQAQQSVPYENSNNMYSMMECMFKRLEEMMGKMLDKIMDRMLDLVMSKLNR